MQKNSFSNVELYILLLEIESIRYILTDVVISKVLSTNKILSKKNHFHLFCMIYILKFPHCCTAHYQLRLFKSSVLIILIISDNRRSDNWCCSQLAENFAS